jgi:hypothetical protein
MRHATGNMQMQHNTRCSIRHATAACNMLRLGHACNVGFISPSSSRRMAIAK